MSEEVSDILCPFCGEVWTQQARFGFYEGLCDCDECGNTFVVVPDNQTFKELDKEALDAFFCQRLKEFHAERMRIAKILKEAAERILEESSE